MLQEWSSISVSTIFIVSVCILLSHYFSDGFTVKIFMAIRPYLAFGYSWSFEGFFANRSTRILTRDLADEEDDTSGEEEIDLLYDPVLNCYFDPKTCKYYELA